MSLIRLSHMYHFGVDLWRRFWLKARKRSGYLYFGWQGKGNVGDDAVFLALRKICPTVTWLPLLEGRKSHIASLLGLQEKHLIQEAVLGGGTTISSEYYLHQTKKLQESGIPVWCCGSGVGSSGWEQETNPDLSGWVNVLNQFKGVGIRGPLSYQKLERIGIKHAEVVGDLALPLAVDRPRYSKGSLHLAVNLSVPFEYRDFCADKMVEAVASVASRWHKNGYRITPLAMDKRDLKPLHLFCSYAGISSRRIVYTNPLSTIQAIEDCVALVGVRLHSAVLAVCAGVPPVLIGYRDKCLDFMTSMDLLSMYIPLSNEILETLEERVEEKLNSIERLNALRRPAHSKAKFWAEVQKRFVYRMIKS